MEKNFQEWALDKEILEKSNSRNIICKNREIWVAKIGVNIGNEISKDDPFLRPVLILNNRLGGDLILIHMVQFQGNLRFMWII